MAQHLEKFEQCPWCGEVAGWSYDYQTCGNCDYSVGRPPYVVNPLSAAFDHVIAERRRQVEVEGWTPRHDDAHVNGEMAEAAACYILTLPDLWPWLIDSFKPKDRRCDLVRAAALIIAEIERLDRAAEGEQT